MDPIETIVIVGAGQAGAWAARTLRDQGFAGRITLVGDEAHAPYERPKLSKEFLSAACDFQTLHVFSPTSFAALAVEWRHGVRATAIDRASRTVALSSGESAPYDRLILCTGGRPLVPPLPGLRSSRVHALRTVDDSLRIREAMASGSTVCVIGGGWIGLEIASTAARQGKKVHVLERGPRLCARVLPPVISQYLLELHTRAGVAVHLNCAVAAIEDTPDGAVVLCEGSQPLRADVVVIGTGMAPNDEIAVAAGLACQRGVLTDSHCRSTDPRILVAGDVAVFPSRWCEESLRLESWQNAQDQAVAAAKNALGQDIEYEPLPWFWSDQHGVNLQMVGLPAATHTAVMRRLGADDQAFICFFLDGDVVRGAVAANAPRELRMTRRLIEAGNDVSRLELANAAVKISSL